MEVMGLMLGEFVDDYTVRVIDVFAMPQTGTVRFQPFSLFRILQIPCINKQDFHFCLILLGCQC